VQQTGPSVSLWTLCALLVVMALKHFLADFLFQTGWIARGKERRQGWFAPLAVHVLIHAAFTLCIALAIAPRLWWLALVDLAVHASVDRCKSLLSQWGGWDATQGQYWWVLGFDQFLHQVTNVALAAALLAL
jgi:Protein of unknown function (DUF3307)